MDKNKWIKLNNGESIPPIFLGTWDIRTQEQADRAVKAAISYGYRGIDSAACYENEVVIRRGIEHSGMDRDKLFVTSKLWNNGHGYDNALRTFDETEDRLGKVDMYLIHWPGPAQSFIETWKALEKIYEEKRVKVIGVSNFMMAHLDMLLEHCRIKPMVNQFESHLWYTDYQLIKYCFDRGIVVEAFSPLTSGKGLLDDEALKRFAAKIGKTPAQVALRYLLQMGVIPLPKSDVPEHIAENIASFDFELSQEEMQTLKDMNRLQRTNKDPFSFFDPDYK